MRLDRQETRAAPQPHKALRLKQIIPYDPFHSLLIRLRHIEISTAITTATKTIATPQIKALRNPICSKLIKSQPTIAKRAVDSRLIKKRRSDIFSRRFSIARLYLAKVNYLKELRDTLDTEVLHTLKEFLTETMDRHAAIAARDDRETNLRESKAAGLKNQKRNNSKHETRRKDFEARIAALQGERGDKAVAYRTSEPKQSTILAQKPTPKKAKAKQ